MTITSISRPWRFRDTIEIVRSDVIKGDVFKQNYTVVGITNHVGVKLKCSKCKCDFYFSAKEQVHWYETLKFWADSVPVECVECRGVSRAICNLNKRLSKVLNVKNMDIKDYNEIVAVSMGLFSNGVMFGGRLAQKIRMAAKRSDHAAKDYLLNITKSI
jgi:hypothetical protein